MQVVLPDVETRATLEVCGDERNGKRPLSDEEFFDFCRKNPELRIERDAGGEITIMPPAGFETGYRNNDLSRQLGNLRWTRRCARFQHGVSSAEWRR
jgi:Uma2 family endonuclease